MLHFSFEDSAMLTGIEIGMTIEERNNENW